MNTLLRQAILTERLQMANNNLLCHSANYLMTTPKKGHEMEWEQVVKEIAELQDWLQEYELVDVYEKSGEIRIQPYQHWNQNDQPSMLGAGWTHHGTMVQKQAEELAQKCGIDMEQATLRRTHDCDER